MRGWELRKKINILKSKNLGGSILYLLVWFKWAFCIIKLFYYNGNGYKLRCIAHSLRLIKAERYLIMYFYDEIPMFWKIKNIFFFFIVYRMSELFLTSHDVHTSSNEVQDRVVSARSASGPLGMTVSRRRWRVITGYEENEFRRRY